MLGVLSGVSHGLRIERTRHPRRKARLRLPSVRLSRAPDVHTAQAGLLAFV
jgi:hypothetical protein